MQQLSKRISVLAVTILFLTMVILGNTVYAKEVEEEREYKPLDLVLVIDGSGSMAASDPSRTAISAGRMLTNMMPASDSRVAIISFNTRPTVHTGDESGNGSLVSLDAFANVETVREALSAVKYSGDTGIGNALLAATELLAQQSDDTRQGAIILFTDGTNDFAGDAIGLARCEENEALALKQASKLGCPVYCVGYDYKLSGGGTSMGANGEGLAKLQNISDTTGGRFKAISTINEMEELLITFLADVCDLNYKGIATIPGDGELHESLIPVSPSVVELDIRIAGGEEGSISKGELHLYDPNGDEVALTNSGNVRFDVDATAASIKVIMPQPGDWKFTVTGVYGDEIHVGMLEHFKMNLKSRLIFPDQNPAGVVYAHDKVGIEAWLTYEGEDLTDKDLYEAATSATATFVSRADEQDVTVVDLKREGTIFKGDFTVPADSFYDITIRISWDTVYREDKLTVMSSNRPLELVGEIEDVVLNKNKSVTIDNIYQYVYDEENDPIVAEVKSVGSPDVVDAQVNGDAIVLTGRKWSSTLVTVQFCDKQGNTVESTFKVKVNDPVALALIIGGIVALIAVVLAIIYVMYKRMFAIRGTMRVGIIKELRVEDGEVVSEHLIFEDKNRLNQDGGIGLVSGGLSPASVEAPAADDPFGTSFVDNPFGASSLPVEDPFAADNPFGVSSGPISFDGVDKQPSASGFAPSGLAAEDPFASDNPFGEAAASDYFGFIGDAGSPNSMIPEFDAQPADSTKEDEEDALLDRTFDGGLLELGNVAGRARTTNLLEVIKAFVAAYEEHMTPLHRRSARAEQVKAFVATRLASFSELQITGSLRGKQGIVIRLPKNSSITMESPRVTKHKVATKQYGNKPIVFVFRLPSSGTDRVTYLEIEYQPPM